MLKDILVDSRCEISSPGKIMISNLGLNPISVDVFELITLDEDKAIRLLTEKGYKVSKE